MTAAGPDAPLGVLLAQLRSRRNWTGVELGRVVGMSQAKISRIETGAGAADPADVEAIARALGAGDDEVRRLVGLATERAQDRMSDWRFTPTGLAGRQVRMRELEALTSAFRFFQPTVVFGLLQTSEYARAIMGRYEKSMFGTVFFGSEGALAVAVAERMRRQTVLADPTKTFHFVMAESVLVNRLCPPEAMPAQLGRLREMAAQENVTLSIVPTDRYWELVPVNGFELFDDRLVEVDLLNTGLTTRGAADVALYRRAFDAYADQATTDIGPILDRYMDHYLDLIRRSRPVRDPDQPR